MKTAIVTGASTGIGRETAIALAGSYENIAITSFRHVTELDALKTLLEQRGTHCYMEAGDAGDFHFISGFFSHITEHFGTSIDLLVNNAAISYVGLLTDMTPEDWDTLMRTNATSVFNTCHEAVPYMVKQKSGRIINISSVWGTRGASCEVAYSASKGAVNAFTKALAKELAPSGIAVNAVAFGAIDTTMNDHLSPEEKQLLADEIPAGRMATAKEAADFIVSVCRTEPYLTGQILTFDGGWQ